MGSFHSSLPFPSARVSGESLPATPEQGTPRQDWKRGWLQSHPLWPLQKRGLPLVAPTPASSWGRAQLHHMGGALGSCLWRGQLPWDQCFGQDSLTPFQEPACREAWGDVCTCPASSPFPPVRMLTEQGMLLSEPSDTRRNSWRSQPSGPSFGENFDSACPRWSMLTGTCLRRTAKSSICAVTSLLLTCSTLLVFSAQFLLTSSNRHLFLDLNHCKILLSPNSLSEGALALHYAQRKPTGNRHPILEIWCIKLIAINPVYILKNH